MRERKQQLPFALFLCSTINILARHHYFITLDKDKVRSLGNGEILSEALDKRLLFVGSRSGPTGQSCELLHSINAMSGGISLPDLERM